MEGEEAKHGSAGVLESGSPSPDPVAPAVKRTGTAAPAEAAAAAIAATSEAGEAAVPTTDESHPVEQHRRDGGSGLGPVKIDAESGLEPGGGAAEASADPYLGGRLSSLSQQEQQDGQDVETAGVSAALAAAAAAAAVDAADAGITSASPAGGEADGKAGGGLASSVLSAFLSTALRHLLPWVLPSALSGARAADVQVDLRRKQVALAQVSLQPQPLMAASGAPLQLLLCTVGSVRLRLKEKERPAAAAAAAGEVGLATPPGGSLSPKSGSQTKAVTAAAAAAAATAAAATAAAESFKNDDASSVVLSVEDVLIVLAPMSAAEWSRQQLLTLALQRRQSQLEAINRELPQQQERRGGFLMGASALVSNWIDRHIECASVDITNVHIRFEALVPIVSSARLSGSGFTPFVLGLTLHQLFIRKIQPHEFEAARRAAAAQEARQQPSKVAESNADENLAASESTNNRKHGEKGEGASSSCTAFDVRHFCIYTDDELLLLTPHTRTAAETIERLRGASPARERMQQQDQQQEQLQEQERELQQEQQQEHEQRQQGQEPEGDNLHVRETGPQQMWLHRLGQNEQQKQQQQAQALEQDERFHDREPPENQQDQTCPGCTREVSVPKDARSEQRASVQSGGSKSDWLSSGSTVVLEPVTVHLFLRKNRDGATLVESDKTTSSTTSDGALGSNEASYANEDSVESAVPSGIFGRAGAEESGAPAATTAAAAAARAAYAAVVQSGCLNATLSPGAVRGIRWLAANAQQHRDAVETAEAVLTLVRPFRPSCKVEGNSGIWWRFAIRAVRRLQRSRGNSDKVLVNLEENLAAEEILKLQLMRDKASNYRQLRLLQLQGKASPQQQALLLKLRDMIPLPLLLQSHTAAVQEFIGLQETAATAGKTWSRWIPLWRRGAPNQTSSTAATNTAGATTGATKLPPLPPLYLHKLLEQQKRLDEKVGEPSRHPSPDTLREDSSSDFDFFDARSQGNLRLSLVCLSCEGQLGCSFGKDCWVVAVGVHTNIPPCVSCGVALLFWQPGTARFKGGNTARRLSEDGTHSGFTGALLQAPRQREKAQAGEATAAPIAQTSPSKAAADEGDANSQGPPSDAAPIKGPSKAHATAHKLSDDSSSAHSSDTSESDDECVFEDCLDFLTPRQPCGSSSSPGLSAAMEEPAVASEPSASESGTQKVLQSEKQQNAYTLSVSVQLSSVSVACCMGGEGRKGVLRSQSLNTQQQSSETRLSCSVECLRLEGLVGPDGMQGTASVRGLGICRTWQTLPQAQTLVCRHPSAGSEPLLLLHLVRGPESVTADGASKNSSRSSNTHQTSFMRAGQTGGTDRPPLGFSNTLVRLQLRRIVCLLDPQALKGMSLIGSSFTAAAKAATAAAARSSQACTLLRLRGTSSMLFSEATGRTCAARNPQHWESLRQRFLLLSPKRQQQLRDSATLRYVVTVEAPTFIAPAFGGQAVICHLGQLRLCSAQLARSSSFRSETASARGASKLAFADNLLEERFEQLFNGRHEAVFRPLESASPEASVAGAERRVRHVSLRMHYGVLLRDSHVLIHPSLDELMSEMHSEPSEDREDSPCVGYWRWSSKDSHCSGASQHQKETPLNARRLPGQGAKHCAASTWAAHSTGWGGCAGTSPILLPSELVAGVHLEHADVFDPGEMLLPLALRRPEGGRPEAAGASASAAAPREAGGGKDKEGARAAQEVASTVLTQRLPPQRLASLQGEQASEIHVRIDGQCSEVSFCLSHSECAALSSTVEALKAALESEEFAAAEGRTAGGVDPRLPSPSECNNSQQPVGADVRSSQRIPVYVTAALNWQRISLYLHHLDSAEPLQAACSHSSSPRDSWRNQGSEEKDALVLQACKVSAHISSSNNSTAVQLVMKHLLLEQPYLPEGSLNRYILRLPSLSAGSASASDHLLLDEGHVNVAADEDGQRAATSAACLLLRVALKSHTATGEGTLPLALSICTLKPMTVNFRPTPLTWLTNFVEDTAGYSSTISQTFTPGSSSDLCSVPAVLESDASPPPTPSEAANAYAALPEACIAAEGISSASSSAEPETRPSEKAVIHSDALLRELRLEFLSIDFLWTARHTDLQLATASLQAASVQMHLRRHSTQLSAGVQNLSLHFVLEDAGASTEMVCFRKPMGRNDSQVRNAACAVSSAEMSPVGNPDNRPTLLTTEILGLMPGTSYAIKIAMESMHPLSPSFSGLGSRLHVEIGTCRLIYLHPKFWRLFNWMVDDFIGTLTSSYPPAPSPPHGTAGAAPSPPHGTAGGTGGSPAPKDSSPEVTMKPIQRCSSLEQLAFYKAQEAATLTGNETRQEKEGIESPSEDKEGTRPVWVSNEGLRRIFVLADAARRLLGLGSTLVWLEEQHQLSAATINNAASKEDGRMIECFLENVIISNSWRLSSRYGLLEDIKVAFKGARAFADLTREALTFDYAHTSGAGAAAEEQQGAVNPGDSGGPICRRCARRSMASPSPNLALRSSGCAASEPVSLGVAASSTNPATGGRYLFGTVDVTVHMYRPALIKTSFPWLRVEVGLLPLRLDAQTLKLLRDVIENNVAAPDPDVLAKLPTPPPKPMQAEDRRRTDEAPNRSTASETPPKKGVIQRFERAQNAELQCTQSKRGCLEGKVQQDLSACIEQLQKQQLLQGLLEPQLDFVELLEEWGNETFLLELIVSGVQLAVYEPPVQLQILQLQQQCASIRQRLMRMQGELQPQQQPRDRTPRGTKWSGRDGGRSQRDLQQRRRPFLLFHATRLTVQMRSLALNLEEAQQVGLVVSEGGPFDIQAVCGSECGLQKQRAAVSRCNPPLAKGMSLGINVGSSTFFAPEFASPFSVVFTDSCCPLELLQQQLEPLADSILSAESEATAVAVAAATSTTSVADPGAATSSLHQEHSAAAEGQDTEQHGHEQQLPPILAQREHPLVSALVLPWVDRLKVESFTEEQPEESGGRQPAARGDSFEAQQYREAFSQSGLGDLGVSSLAPQGILIPERQYHVLFPLSGERSLEVNEQRSRISPDGTPGVASSSQATELKFHYWSAATLPVTPLADSASSALENLANFPWDEQLQIVRGSLKGRQHQRRQRRITSSSRSPRCVLSLPLLARTREFLSSDKQERGGAFAPAPAERGHGSVQGGSGVPRRSNKPRGHSSDGGGAVDVVAPLPSAPSVQGESLAVKKNGLASMFVQKAPPYRCSSSVHARPRRDRNMGSLSRSCSTGASPQTSKARRLLLRWGSSGSDSCTSGGVSSPTQRSGSKNSQTRVEAIPASFTHFGSKALDLCLSSFESAQQFAAALDPSGNAQGHQDLYPGENAQGHQHFYQSVAGGGELAKGSSPVNSGIDISEGRGSECTAVRPRRGRKVSVPSLSSQKPSLPVELTSMEVLLQLSNASVLLPVDTTESASGSLLLRGCVDLRRRVDAAQDPLAPGGMSGDAANAEHLYTKARHCLLGSNSRISRGYGSDGSSFAAKRNAGAAQRQEDARWQGALSSVDRLKDRFCPGVKVVDFLLQRAALTCLGNSCVLQRLEASAADLHNRRKQLELRHLRALRRSGSSAKAKAHGLSSPDREEETGVRLQRVASRKLTAAAALREVAIHTVSADVARDNSSEILRTNVNDDGLAAWKGAGAASVGTTAAQAADAGGSARLICSDFRAHLSHFHLPTSALGRRQIGSSSAKAGVSEAQGKSTAQDAQKFQGQLRSRSPDGGCCCSPQESSGITEPGALQATPCDCCCHHPQDFNTLRVSPCELELSYVDCLLVCRYAAEQTRQLDEVQKRQQHLKHQVARQTKRWRALQQQLILSTERNTDLFHEDRRREEPVATYRQLFTPTSLVAGSAFGHLSHIRERKLSGIQDGNVVPAAAAVERQATAAAQSTQVASALPRQTHFFADLPLLRITLLNDHLDCLQAPLLQLLLLQCRLTRASSVLPLHPLEAGALPASPEDQRQQVAAVSLGEASLRLWALNPVAVAFEPVIESLPLSLIVREAPYPIMRSAYEPTFDDDGMARASTPPLSSLMPSTPASSRVQSSGNPVDSSEGSQLETEHGPQEGASSNEESLPKAASPVFFRFDGNAADLEACAFFHEDICRRGRTCRQILPGSHSATGPSKEHELKLMRDSLHRPGSVSLTRGSPDSELYRRNSYFISNNISNAAAAGRGEVKRRYLGILLSCPKDSGIEANLSPLLLQSVLGSLTKWHSDFAQHVQHEQQRRTTHGVSTKRAAARHASGPKEGIEPSHDPVQMIEHDNQSTVVSVGVPHQRREFGSDECDLAARLGEQKLQQAQAPRFLRQSSSLDVDAVKRKREGDDLHQERVAAASPAAARGAPATSERQKQEPVVQVSDPRRGRLFIPYHIVNQTGMELGVSLLSPSSASLLGLDAKDGETHATKRVSLPSNLPSTLRLCRSRGQGDESSGSDPHSSSDASDAGKGSNLTAASIHWDFGPALLKALISSPASGADGDKSSKWPASCPPPPSASPELTATSAPGHAYASGGCDKWDWLQPSEEKALRQMRVAIGTAATVHFALQLVGRYRPTVGSRPSLTATTTAEVPAKEVGSVCSGRGSLRQRWRLVVPVPLDRVGVYIQPLTNKVMEKDTKSVETSARQKERNIFVICRVVADAGMKRLLIQSQVVLRSSCSCPLEVLLLSRDALSLVSQEQAQNEGDKDTDEAPLQRVILSPGKTAAVPVDRTIRVRPVQAGCSYTWSRDLQLATLWQVQREADQHRVRRPANRGPAGPASKSSLPKLDLLRCCPTESNVGGVSPRACEVTFPEGLEREKKPQQRQVDFHMVILYHLERLFHSSLSCVQLNVSFGPPLRLASNIPFPVRYKVHSPVASRVGEGPPEDLEGLLKINDCQQIHSFPLAAETAQAPTAAAGSAKGQSAGSRMTSDAAEHRQGDASAETLTGDTVVEVECMDKRHRVAKLWVVFCDSDGGIPSLLIHAPVWLVSYVNWALQLQPQQQTKKEGHHGKSSRLLPSVEFRTIHRKRLTNGGWALQAVSAAAAAVDLNPASGHQRPKPVARFGLPAGAGLTKDRDGEIQLLDFNTASFRVEAEGVGQSEYVDLWGEFPKTLQVTARSTSAQVQLASVTENSRDSSPHQSPAEAAEGRSRTNGGASSSQPASPKSAACLDLIAAMGEAPMPLLRPVLVLTVGPMFTVTNGCPFPLRVRQARPGYSCKDDSSMGADFMMELLPQQTLPLVWQSAKGSREVQFQRHRALENALTPSVWSAWSGYSPLCPSGEEWCLRLPASPGSGRLPTQPQAYSAKGDTVRKREQKQETVKSREERPDQQDTESWGRQPLAGVGPPQLLRSLLRRGVVVEFKGRYTGINKNRSLPRSSCAGLLSVVSGCSIRLATEEGAASSISLVLREEKFQLRDAVAISNNTPLPLLVRQCRHKDSAPSANSKPVGGWSSRVGGNFPFSEAAALGVDSVATAVADLWEAATRSGYEDQHGLNQVDSGSALLHSATIYGGQNTGAFGGNVESSRQLINALLEKQRRAEQQQRLQRPQGATFSHSSNAVYISSSPQREAVKRQLDRLVALAEAVVGSSSLKQDQTHQQLSAPEPFSSSEPNERCVWCRFDSAAAHELRVLEREVGALSQVKEDGPLPPTMWPFPQLVLPGETILFAWDDYRCLPCVELSYYPWLQRQQQRGKSSPDRDSGQGRQEDDFRPSSELLSLERPFVICIPLHPSVSGVLPLMPLPSSCWLLFRVVRYAGRLRMEIVPAANLSGLPSPYAPVIPAERKSVSSDSGGQERVHHTLSHSSVSRSHAVDGSRPGWGSSESEHIVASPENVDVDSVLSMPRYFLLPTVKDELDVVCSRSGSSSGTNSRVPSWSYASMCRFAEAVAGSYSAVRNVTRAAMATSAGAAKPVTGERRSKDAEGALRPTPEPPVFELRIDVPRMQLSVLSQGPVTDPLYRQATTSSSSSSQVERLGSDMKQQPLQRGKGGNQGGPGSGAGAGDNARFEPLVEFLLQQRQPLFDDYHPKLILVDKCCIALRPVSVKTDLNSFYVATEALGCWRAAWAAATESAQLQLRGSMRSAARAGAFGSSRRPGDAGMASSTEGSFVHPEFDVPIGTKAIREDLDYNYSLTTGLEWACNANSRWRFPFSLFASTLPEPGIGAAPSPLLLRPLMVKRTPREMPEIEEQNAFRKRQKRYVFRLFSIAETCIVLSLKADTGGDISALRRSVVTLSSLEEARFQVDGLSVTGHRLIEKLRELQQQQQPQLQEGLSLLSQVQKYQRLPALALRDVARLVGHFYRQQFVGHLSKVLVSVDLLGNPALSLAHLQAGIYALARQPLEAAETGGDVFQGMMRGAEDFLKHTGYGFFGGISRMAGVASDSLGALACDEVYIHARKQQGRQKARNVEEGLQQGVEALGRALAGGFTGLVEEPVRGAAEGGFEGLIRGAGRGIAGFLVKPITGVLDLAHKTAEAIKDASQIEAYQRPRRRLPRMLLGPSRLLVAYDKEAAEAKAILTDAEGQNWGNLPALFFALEKRLQRLTVLTESHVLLFKINVRGPAELQFLSPIARVLAVGHCSVLTSSGSSSSSRNTPARERHLVVLQLRRTGEAGVCYKWLAYSSAQLQRHILHSLRQLLLQ
ncbi:hypothetical protein ACSSS7_004067 [Eimeria intestinalis]